MQPNLAIKYNSTGSITIDWRENVLHKHKWHRFKARIERIFRDLEIATYRSSKIKYIIMDFDITVSNQRSVVTLCISCTVWPQQVFVTNGMMTIDRNIAKKGQKCSLNLSAEHERKRCGMVWQSAMLVTGEMCAENVTNGRI